MCRIRFTISAPSRVRVGEFKVLGVHVVEVDDMVQFPYNKILDSFRILYPGKGVVIDINIV